jgi:hypothetical protein
MDHVLKGRWHSYLIGTTETGDKAEIQQDGANHVMDLTKIKENGQLDDGTHNGKRITGKAIPIESERTFFLTIDYVDGSRRYEGFLVRDKLIGSKKIKLVAGRYIFFRALDRDQFFELSSDGVLRTTQEEGTWVITHP